MSLQSLSIILEPVTAMSFFFLWRARALGLRPPPAAPQTHNTHTRDLPLTNVTCICIYLISMPCALSPEQKLHALEYHCLCGACGAVSHTEKDGRLPPDHHRALHSVSAQWQARRFCISVGGGVAPANKVRIAPFGKISAVTAGAHGLCIRQSVPPPHACFRQPSWEHQLDVASA